MRVDLRYQGASAVRELLSGLSVSFAPNLARPKVFFDAELEHPVRFREAISALHAVVVGDLKFKPRDRSAHDAWKLRQAEEEETIRRTARDRALREEVERFAREPIPDNLEADFQRMHGMYWKARRRWASELAQNDPALFRALVPCDPVVTVAPDAVLFECFSKDESSYGCLSVDRGAFRAAGEAGLGTTNVDYSLALFEHFQTLRSYRPTRLQVDPAGFEVRIESSLREEKIDLPSSWLRGFGQLQAAMTLPAERIQLSVDAVYSILSQLRRRREKTGPRSLRFALTPGRPPAITLEPWGLEVVSRSAPYAGAAPRQIPVWGRRRLLALARVLPLAEHFEVALLGPGLPSIWIARLGEMTLTLALSGWTANDFTSGTNLDTLFAGTEADRASVERVRGRLETERSASFSALESTLGNRALLASALHVLAKRGEVVYDYSKSVYRFRPILPVELSERTLGPESPELVHGRRLVERVQITREESLPSGKSLYVAKVDGTSCEGILDADGQLSGARCTCSFHFRTRLRAGPCRHLLALRLRVQRAPALSS